MTRVVELNVPDDVLTDRIAGRWMHKASGRSYHVTGNPPKSYLEAAANGERPTTENMLDDETGDALYQRADDTREALPARIATYHSETVPILNHYGKVKKTINADAPTEKVKGDALRAVGVGDLGLDGVKGGIVLRVLNANFESVYLNV